MNESTEYRGYFIGLEQDEGAESPREWSNLGTMICWHRDYQLGDKHNYHDSEAFWLAMAYELQLDSLAEYFENGDIELQALVNAIMDSRSLIILPLLLLDHSGLWMRTTRFVEDSAGWDTSRVGYIYCTKQEALKKWDAKSLQAKVKQNGSGKITVEETAKQLLETEVEVYSQYLSGDVWGYIITDDEDNEIDSLWGLYGYEYAQREAESFVDGLIEKAEVEVQQERVGM